MGHKPVLTSRSRRSRERRHEPRSVSLRPLVPGGHQLGDLYHVYLQFFQTGNSAVLSGWLQTRYPGLDLLSHNAGHLWSTLLGEKGNPHFGILHIASYVALACGFPWYCLPPLAPGGHWRGLAKGDGLAAALWVGGY